MKLKYVGLKLDGEAAFERDTGLVWMPGDEHEVTEALAVRMLAHPDVFARVEAPLQLEAPLPAEQGLTATPAAPAKRKKGNPAPAKE